MLDDGSEHDDVTEAMIARRAFEIWLVEGSGPPDEHWLQAERELRAEQAARRAKTDDA
jgi:hypothetical protein